MNNFIYEIIESKEFFEGIEEISYYAFSTSQEKHIQFLIAKLLDKKDYLIALENKRYDLVIKDKTIEFESCYEEDFNDFSRSERIFKKGDRIYRDIKRCDLFILIGISRDLNNISKEIKKYVKIKRKIEDSKTNLENIDKLLDLINIF